MKKGLFASVVTLLVSAPWALAQPPMAATLPFEGAGTPYPAYEAPSTDHAGWSGHGDCAAGSCGHGDCAACACKAPSNNLLWFSGEYLLWWIKDGPNPTPLATLGDRTLSTTPGAIGEPGTRVILGGSDLDYGTSSGGRVTAGIWIAADQRLGLEVSGFLLEKRGTSQTVRSDDHGIPQIFRPLNEIRFGESTFFVSAPGAVAGSISLYSSSRLWGAEANFVTAVSPANGWRLTFLGGFRHLNLEERIDISTFQHDFGGILADPIAPGFAQRPGTILTVTDSFRTRNLFYGVQLGARAEYSMPSGLYFDLRGKVALGLNRQELNIDGRSTSSPGSNPAADPPVLPTATVPGGVLATASNSGHFSDERFCVAPEVETRVGYQLGNHLRTWVGYNFLYMSQVLRPGDQINRTVDFRSIPTATIFNPAFQAQTPPPPAFRSTEFWAHGASAGLELRY